MSHTGSLSGANPLKKFSWRGSARARTFRRFFFGLWAVYLTLALLVLLWLGYQSHNHSEERILVQESTRLNSIASNVAYDLAQAITHLKYLEQSPALSHAVTGDAMPQTRETMVELFKVFIANGGLYSCIQLIDLQGREVFRIDASDNGKPRITPSSGLRNQAGTLYFREGRKLGPDEVYISALEGASFSPGESAHHQPRLRLVATTYDGNRRKTGILVLTMGGERLWRGLQDSKVNGIVHPVYMDRQESPDGEGATVDASQSHQPSLFAGRYPKTARVVRARGAGIAHTAEGVFVFVTLRPASMVSQQLTAGMKDTRVFAGEAAWKLISVIPDSVTAFRPWIMLWGDPALFVLVLILTAIVSAMVAWARAQALAHEAQTRESEAQLRTVLDNTLALAFLKDREGRYLFANRRFREMIGSDPEEFVGKQDQELFPDPEATAFRANDLAVLQSGAPREFEEIVTTEHGERVFISVKFPLQQPDGSLAVCGISTDITERKHAEEAMRLAAVVFENTNEGIIVTNAEHRIIAVNSAYTSITGYSAGEVMGQRPNVHASGTHDEDFYQELWRVLKESDQWQGEIWDRHKDGHVIPLWENISVVRDDAGRVINYVAVMSDISAIKQAEERLTFLAHHDSLTGLPNRLLFYSSLDQAMVEARRGHRRVAVMLLDLDRFKLVNDTFGHAAGDQLLKAVADRLLASVRAEDTVCRLGGDEFTIILRDVGSGEDLVGVAEKIIQAVERPLSLKGQEVSIGVSIGISLYPDDAVTGDSLATAADTAMYRAKERGKRTFEFYAAEMTAAASRRLTLETELRDALQQDQFELYYQPQVDMQTGRPIGMEALLRWNHPRRGLLLPGQFISVAEESGLIHAIGRWVIETGCRQAAEWQREGCMPGPVSMNVSAHQLTRDRLGDFVETAMVAERLAGDAVALELEITESVLVLTDQSERLLYELKALGVKIVIDDFGTGFSSLSQLRRLPVDKIKIAGEFVKDIPVDENDMAIASAIISLGQSLGLPVIAEGVETFEQAHFLRERGCQIAQGFYYSRPLAAAEAGRLFRRTQAAGGFAQLELPEWD